MSRVTSEGPSWMARLLDFERNGDVFTAHQPTLRRPDRGPGVGGDSPFVIPPFWVRTRDRIEDDPLLCACALTVVSDIGPVPVARPPGMPKKSEVGYAASLDHAVWFHRPYVPDEWHRYGVSPRTNADARGLVFGSMYDRAGALVASTTQEALWRV